jgi:class 3 adenylate cyclase/tetratricopeptide (TPR) repeat protein
MEKRESERRQATIIFADISGFTEMSEKLDPEEVTAIMGDCFAVLGAVVSDHGGTVDKYIGDCVMALFGAPRALENGPEKAIAAALRMLGEIETFNCRHGLAKPLGLHIGVNTGEVLSGELGSKEKRDFTVMGDAVNLASRLKDACGAGRILVGPQTWRYARESFRFKPLQPIDIKGKEELVQAYEVVGPEACEGGTSTSRMIQSSLVGRERELSAIATRIEGLLKGAGSVVALAGEAGIGKSRLTAELRAWDCMKSLTVLEGHAVNHGRNLSYHPIIDILKSWSGIAEDDPEDTAFGKLDSAIHAIDAEDADAAVPFVGALMGYRPTARYAGLIEGIKGESFGKLIVKHSRDIIAKASLFRPILFVLEDMQWADDSSFEFLKGIIGLASTNPVMFLFTWRPGYAETTEGFMKGIAEGLNGSFQRIELPPLETDNSRQLVRNLLRDAGVSPKVVERIVEKSDGNPFFIEETIRSFIDMGAIDPERGGPAAAQELESIEIPNSIDAVIMSRIDRLDEEMRQLLRIASVIGRSFFFRVLARICGPGNELGACIQQLEEMQILRHRTRLDELEFLFKHVLVQETIYRSILLRSRKEIHLNVAGAIEDLFAGRSGEFSAVLAYHYMQAGELDRAEKYLEMAGKAAMDSAASSEALVFFQQALDIYRRKAGKDAAPERLAQFERIIGKAYQNKGLMQKAVEHYDVALENLGVGRKNRSGKVIAAAAGFLSILRFLYLPATRSRKPPTEREMEIIRIMNDREWAVANVDSTEFFLSGFNAVRWLLLRDPFNATFGLGLLCVISQLLSVTGLSFALAKRILELVEPHLKSDSDRSVFMDAENFLNLLSGKRECRYEDRLVDSFVEQGDFTRGSLYVAFRGICAICRGDFAEAGRIAAKTRAIADEYEDEGSLTKYLENLVLSDLVRRTGSPALENESALVTAAARIGEDAVQKIFLAYQADALMARGDLRDAKPVIDEMARLLAKDRIPLPLQALPPLMTLLSYNTRRYLLAKDEAERSGLRKETRPVLKAIRRYGPKYAFRYPEALRLAGTFAWLTGRQSKAFALWSEGLRVAGDLRLRPELGRIGFEVAKRLSSPGCRRKTLDKLPASSYAAASRKLFSEIGLDLDLQELEDWEKARAAAV